LLNQYYKIGNIYFPTK